MDCDASRLHCTAENIHEARVAHFYSTRGYTASEQEADTRRYVAQLSFQMFLKRYRFRANPRNQHLIRRQIDELAAAQAQRDGPLRVPDNTSPPESQMRLGFIETVQPLDYDIPECHVFKVTCMRLFCVRFRDTLCFQGIWSLQRSIKCILERSMEQLQVTFIFDCLFAVTALSLPFPGKALALLRVETPQRIGREALILQLQQGRW